MKKPLLVFGGKRCEASRGIDKHYHNKAGRGGEVEEENNSAHVGSVL